MVGFRISAELLERNELSCIVTNFENLNTCTALKQIKELEKSDLYSKLLFREKLLLFNYKIRLNNILKSYESSVLAFNDMQTYFESSDQKNDSLNELIFSTLQIWRLRAKKEFEQIKKVIEKIKSLINDLQYIVDPLIQKFTILFYIYVADYYKDVDKPDIMLQYLRMALNKAKIFGNNYCIYDSYNQLIEKCFNTNKDLEVQTYFEESQLLFENLNQPLLKIKLVINLMALHMWAGWERKALKYSEKVYEFINNYKSAEESWIYLKHSSNICRGIIYFYMGKYSESLEWTLKAEEYAKILHFKFEKPGTLSGVYGNIGELYFFLDKKTEALEYFLKALELRLSRPDDILPLSDSYYSLIRLFVEIDDPIDAEFHLKNFDSYITKWNQELLTDSDQFNAYYSIAKAIVLISKKSMKTNSEAQTLLKKVVEEYSVKVELIIEALLPLIELTIQEFKLFQNEEIFKTLKDLFNNLNNLVTRTSSVILKIQSLILQGKLYIISGDFKQFEEFFNQAKAIAKEYELENIEKWINSELDTFKIEYNKWQSLISSNVSLKERIELSQLEDYVKSIQHILYED